MPAAVQTIQRTSYEEPQPAGGSKTNKETMPLSPPHRESLIPLAPSKQNGFPRFRKKSPYEMPSMVTVAGSLGVVLGIFLLFAWLMRQGPQSLAALPNEAFEVLGRVRWPDGRMCTWCMRNQTTLGFGNAGRHETLTEITDPKEVDRLAGLCIQSNPHSSTAAFRQIFPTTRP